MGSSLFTLISHYFAVMKEFSHDAFYLSTCFTCGDPNGFYICCIVYDMVTSDAMQGRKISRMIMNIRPETLYHLIISTQTQDY